MASGYYGGAHGNMMAGRYEDALKKIKKAISLDPDGYMLSLYTAKLGEIYMRMEKYEEAIPVLEETMDQITKKVDNPPAEVDTDIFFQTGQYLQFCRDRIENNKTSQNST